MHSSIKSYLDQKTYLIMHEACCGQADRRNHTFPSKERKPRSQTTLYVYIVENHFQTVDLSQHWAYEESRCEVADKDTSRLMHQPSKAINIIDKRQELTFYILPLLSFHFTNSV